MQQTTGDIIVSIAAFTGIFGIAYVYLMTRYKERMFMIERKVEASLLAPKHKSASLTLKCGMLLVGIALGILTGNLLHNYFGLGEEAAYLSMVCLLGGLSLIVNFLIEQKLYK